MTDVLSLWPHLFQMSSYSDLSKRLSWLERGIDNRNDCKTKNHIRTRVPLSQLMQISRDLESIVVTLAMIETLIGCLNG